MTVQQENKEPGFGHCWKDWKHSIMTQQREVSEKGPLETLVEFPEIVSDINEMYILYSIYYILYIYYIYTYTNEHLRRMDPRVLDN